VFKVGGEGLGYYADNETAVDFQELSLKNVEPPREWAIGMRVIDEDGFFATVRCACGRMSLSCFPECRVRRKRVHRHTPGTLVQFEALRILAQRILELNGMTQVEGSTMAPSHPRTHLRRQKLTL
jgi:hypothetical protein